MTTRDAFIVLVVILVLAFTSTSFATDPTAEQILERCHNGCVIVSAEQWQQIQEMIRYLAARVDRSCS